MSEREPFRDVVRARMSLQYQITGELDTSVDAQLYVIDLFDNSAARVKSLHDAGRRVIAYLSAGSLERWRDDAAQFPREVIGETLAQYPNEAWLDIRSAQVRSLMESRFELARSRGFDGVFVSTLGLYRIRSGFALTEADQLDYDLFLADTAHALGLSAGLSGDFALGAPLADAFDWALDTGCIARDACAALRPFQDRSKPVFDLEVSGSRDAMCQAAAAHGVTAILKRDSYDAWRQACP